jgi:hypothetical protein
MLGNETGNKMVTPDKKREVVHVVHNLSILFTTIPGSLGTLCAPYYFRQQRDDLFHFSHGGIATE